MAIQVNGTTVIDDSRNLSNVGGLKTINGSSIIGSGDITAGGTSPFSYTSVVTGTYGRYDFNSVTIPSGATVATIMVRPTISSGTNTDAIIGINGVDIFIAKVPSVQGDYEGCMHVDLVNGSYFGAYSYRLLSSTQSNKVRWIANHQSSPSAVTTIEVGSDGGSGNSGAYKVYFG